MFLPLHRAPYRYAAYVVLLWVALAAYPFSQVMAGVGCAPFKHVIAQKIRSGFAVLSTATTNKIAVVFVVNRNGDWQILGVDDDESSCVIAQGTEWRFMWEREI